jgi:L-arabinose isomerase
VFGWSVNGWGVGELARGVQELPDSDVKALLDEYAHTYVMPKDSSSLEAIREQAKMELVIRRFLEAHQGIGFTTTFEDLHGLKQLPGLAVQRLMAVGYGFGAEGDWKTAALVRAVKVMASGLPGGTSFMEDYTYHMEKGREAVLGAHMLEICPSIAGEKPRIEVHPLSIGGKADPARLVFDGQKGPAINASLIDLGNRFRLLINPVESLAIPQKMPKRPVARVLWRPKPDFQRGLEAWILAGGAHHTVFSTAIDKEYLLDWASMVGIEAVVIDEGMGDVERFQNELRWGEIYWGMSGLTR